MADTCRSCGAPILWAVTSKGRRAPIDPEPTAKGNVRIERRQGGLDGEVAVALSLSQIELVAARAAGEQLRTSHFATCPNAAQHRSKR